MGTRLDLDHIVVAAETLAEGVAAVEELLGVTMAPGGAHAVMGTHNRLLSLGETYLEVIAIVPDAPAPPHARWYGLDEFAGPPRVTNWAARTDDMDAALVLAPAGTGLPMQVTRGDLSWTMAVPEDGHLPFGDAFPALISWHGGLHPATRLPDVGCRLSSMEVGAVDPGALRDALARFEGGLASYVVDGGGAGFAVTVRTPRGLIRLP